MVTWTVEFVSEIITVSLSVATLITIDTFTVTLPMSCRVAN